MSRIPLLFAFLFPLLLSGCMPSAQTQLEQYVAKENQNLPKRIDANTTLIKLVAKPLEIEFFYSVNGFSNEQVLENQEMFENKVRDTLKANRGELKMQARSQIKFTYVYQDRSNSEIFRFTVNTWEL